MNKNLENKTLSTVIYNKFMSKISDPPEKIEVTIRREKCDNRYFYIVKTFFYLFCPELDLYNVYDCNLCGFNIRDDVENSECYFLNNKSLTAESKLSFNDLEDFYQFKMLNSILDNEIIDNRETFILFIGGYKQKRNHLIISQYKIIFDKMCEWSIASKN